MALTPEEKERWTRCRQCPHCGRGGCTLIGDFYDVKHIVECPKEWPEIVKLEENSLEHYLFYRNSIEYFRWLSYQRRDRVPKKGDLCLTLTGGFSSYQAGRQVIVGEYLNEYNLELHDKVDSEKKFCVQPAKWWEKLYVMKEA